MSTVNVISGQILSPIIILEELNENKINKLLANHDIDTFAYRNNSSDFLKYRDISIMKTRNIKCIKCKNEMTYENLKRHLLNCIGKCNFCSICETTLVDISEDELRNHMLS